VIEKDAIERKYCIDVNICHDFKTPSFISEATSAANACTGKPITLK